MAAKKTPSNRGGPRAGSGRKRKATTIAKARILAAVAGPAAEPTVAEKNDAADYAFRLFNDTMRDRRKGLQTRLDCARQVLDRVWGKPAQTMKVGNLADKPFKVYLDLDIERV
jgi:hypothetical protein